MIFCWTPFDSGIQQRSTRAGNSFVSISLSGVWFDQFIWEDGSWNSHPFRRWLAINWMEITKPLHQKCLEIIISIHLDDGWGRRRNRLRPKLFFCIAGFVWKNTKFPLPQVLLWWLKPWFFTYPGSSNFVWQKNTGNWEFNGLFSFFPRLKRVFRFRPFERKRRSGGRSRRSWEINCDRRSWRVNSHCFAYGRGGHQTNFQGLYIDISL